MNAIRPGFIYTNIHADGSELARITRFAPQIPLQISRTASEVANTIVWLLSDEASYVRA